jgi:serine/threonine-protein kinase
MPEATKTQAAQTIGKYELIRPIGDGNMGTVYLARDPFTLRDVAVKIATPKPADDDRIARRRRKLFYIEAKAAGMLRHPNIVATIDAGIEEDRRYIVMEYVQNAGTLDRYCRPDNLLPIEHVVGIMQQCAIAFDFAHTQGVVHRDIKPKNIMLTQDNEVKICDFGLHVAGAGIGGDGDQPVGHFLVGCRRLRVVDRIQSVQGRQHLRHRQTHHPGAA